MFGNKMDATTVNVEKRETLSRLFGNHMDATTVEVEKREAEEREEKRKILATMTTSRGDQMDASVREESRGEETLPKHGGTLVEL